MAKLDSSAWWSTAPSFASSSSMVSSSSSTETVTTRCQGCHNTTSLQHSLASYERAELGLSVFQVKSGSAAVLSGPGVRHGLGLRYSTDHLQQNTECCQTSHPPANPTAENPRSRLPGVLLTVSSPTPGSQPLLGTPFPQLSSHPVQPAPQTGVVPHPAPHVQQRRD